MTLNHTNNYSKKETRIPKEVYTVPSTLSRTITNNRTGRIIIVVLVASEPIGMTMKSIRKRRCRFRRTIAQPSWWFSRRAQVMMVNWPIGNRCSSNKNHEKNLIVDWMRNGKPFRGHHRRQKFVRRRKWLRRFSCFSSSAMSNQLNFFKIIQVCPSFRKLGRAPWNKEIVNHLTKRSGR